MKEITSNVSVSVVMMVPPGVEYLTVTCNGTEYGRANTTMQATTGTRLPTYSGSRSTNEHSRV